MNNEGGARRHLRAWRLAFVAALLATAAGASAAGDMYKCGKVYQDRPCETGDVQQRFSNARGTFSIEQVNPGTDQDCARFAADMATWRRRMAAGEPQEKLQAELLEKKATFFDKNGLRDALTLLKGMPGSERDVRSQFEARCMAFKRRKGIATEADDASQAGARR